ncbi:MAG: DUF1080 domain-containing protein [Planctomycetia bacterium]|nr:DUF1080 domain-containing protein [Planctomycetia bacterium]
MKKFLLSLTIALCATSLFAEELFNGKNLDGWYTFLKDRGTHNDPNGVFTVRNDLLHISGQEFGCITTQKEFSNYKLTLEYRWTGKTQPPRVKNARDCGVLVHSVGDDGSWHGTWIPSIECNIIEGGTGDFIVVGDGTENFSISTPCKPEKQKNCGVFDPTEKGERLTIHSGRINWFDRDPNWTDTVGFRGSKDLEKPLGQWNTLVVIADGDTLVNILNGTVVNKAYNVRPTAGKIQIQSEAAGIEFRSIRLEPLGK